MRRVVERFTQSPVVLPLSRLDEFANLALDQVAFQRADVTDVEFAVQVIGFVLKGPCQQIFAGFLEDLSRCILRAYCNYLRTAYIFAKVRNAKATFAL